MPPQRTILHVDMDAFYAAIEQRDRPELRGRPVVVGADPQAGRGRGVVSTASYEARRFGVGSALPISQAYRLCPHAAYLPVDMEKYARVSEQVMAVMRDFTDLVEPLSVDEAFLDVTGSRRLFGDGEQIGRKLKDALRDATQLTASVGVATSKLVAKVASEREKPDGLVVVPPGQEAAFLAPLPLRCLWGVGPKMEARLRRAGMTTLGDLARADDARRGVHGHELAALARGEDTRPVIAHGHGAKSVGHEHTYGTDTDDVAEMRRTLLSLADGVGRRLRAQGLEGRTVTLKYRDETFRTLTRAATLRRASAASGAIFDVAWKLFEGVHGQRRVRLLGISVSGFGARQQGLFDAAPPAADRLRDDVAQRFGTQALTRASLLPRPGSGPRSGPRRPLS